MCTRVQLNLSPFRADKEFINSLVLRFVKDQFDDYRESTIGGKNCDRTVIAGSTDIEVAAFLTQTVALDDGTNVKFEIWCACFASIDAQY